MDSDSAHFKPRQIVHMDTEPQVELMQPIKNRLDHSKPAGGLWTSTEVEEGVSSWTLNIHERGETGPCWALKPKEDARIFQADSAQAEHFLREHYGTALPEDDDQISQILRKHVAAGVIDWEAVAKDWDAVHFAPVWPLRISEDGQTSVFDQWDVESTLWLNWAFAEVISLESPSQNQARPQLEELNKKDFDPIRVLESLDDIDLEL